MSRQQGTFSTNGTIEPKVDAPLDARLQVKTKADLTTPGTFQYKYKGMIVSVVSEQKAYMLIGDDPTFIVNWKPIGEGGSGSGGVELTWEQYQQLSEEEKMNGTTYYIKDGDSTINLEDLVNVHLVNVSNGQVLKFNQTTQKWENDNESGGGGGGSALQSITYNEPILTLTYDDGSTYDFNVRDSILRVTELGDLGNVIDSTIQNTNVLQYDTAIQGYKPYDIVAALTALLNSAKTYTDEEIASAVVADAHYCDNAPSCQYDSVQDKYIVTYVQNGVTKTTDATTDRFCYKDGDDAYSTSWFITGTANDPVEFTYLLSNLDMDDFIKTTDIVSTYSPDMVDKTKLPDIAALDALMTLVSTALGLKVNTADIIDDLTHTDANKPLSANQGKVLKGLVDGLGDSKNDKMQFVTMPTASVDLLNKIYQYVGASTATYTSGAFYRCIYDTELDTYLWELVSNGGGGGSDLDVDGTTITKNENNIISAVQATNGTAGIVKGGEGVTIADDGSVNVVNRLVITAELPAPTANLVGAVRLLTNYQTGYKMGGIYQCQVTSPNVYQWVMISLAEVDPTQLSNAIANDVEGRNILIFGE